MSSRAGGEGFRRKASEDTRRVLSSRCSGRAARALMCSPGSVCAVSR